jgi:cell division protein FtsQ
MKSRLRWLKWIAAIALVVVMAAVANLAFNWPVIVPGIAVKEVVIKGELQRIKREIPDALVGRVMKGNFFTVDIGNVQSEFEKLPWVRSASIRRIWPDRLEVTLDEHVPLAHWGSGALLNDHGEIFKAEYEGDLPRFVGPAGSEKEMTSAYLQYQSQLRKVGRRVVEITMSARRAWSVKLDSGMVLALGRSDAQQRLERFVAVDKLIPELKDRRGYVDLRYPNGFAVKLLGRPKNKENVEATTQ